MMKKFLSSALLSGHLILFATPSLLTAHSKGAEKSLIRINPYLMPDDHPIKEELDDFFSQERWTFNENSLKEGGFSHWIPRKFTRVIVAKHPLFPGYVFKIYTDVQRYYKGVPESDVWARRAEGANLIRAEIALMGWEAYMKTPHKWIYKLPDQPKPIKGFFPKRYILVEEDMDLLSDEDNATKWKSNEVTFETLDRLYHMLDKFMLLDCAKIVNVPFGKDGRIAFIDTQTFNAESVTWDSLNSDLNSANRSYWKKLTHQ